MTASILLFLRAHWKLAAGIAGLVGAFAGGWFAHRPPPAPAVALQQASASTQAASSASATHEVAQPVDRIIDRTYYGDDALPTVQLLPGTPGATPVPRACPPARVVEHIVEHAGAVVTDTKTQEQHVDHQEQKLHLTVTPAPLPRYSLLLGGQVLPGRRLALGGAVRGPDLPVLGPVWVQVELLPQLTDPLKTPVVVVLRKDF